MFVKYAKFDGAQILDIKGAPTKQKQASLAKLSEFEDWQTHLGYLYCRIRAISSRVNANFDSWGSVDLAGSPDVFNQHRSSSGFVVQANKDDKFGFSTFLGKPIFIDHNNSDPKRARGIVVDAKLHVEDHKTAALDPFYSSPEAEDYHLPPTWVELLLEVDAKSFPKFAQAILDGAKDPTQGIDGFSMGSNIRESYCNICNNKAEDESDFCQHIRMKGAQFKALDSKTGKKVLKKAAEKCCGISFFEISGVFQPADETALTQELITSIKNERPRTSKWNRTLKTANVMGEDRICPACKQGVLDPDHAYTCTSCGFKKLADLGFEPEEPPEYDINRKPKERVFSMPCQHCGQSGIDMETGGDCPYCEGRGISNQKGQSLPRGDITGLIDPNDPSKYPKMPQPLEDALMSQPRNNATYSKTAEADLPQIDMLSVPEKVDTLRKTEICSVCGSSVDRGSKCEVCGNAESPDSLDNPDLAKAKELAQKNDPNNGTRIEGYPDPLEMQPPPRVTAPNFQSNAHTVISDMEWTLFHPKLGMGKINPVERPVLPTGPPATNDPTKETIISQPSGPVISKTAAQMIAAVKQQENQMETKTADAASGAPAVATPDVSSEVMGVGGVMDASNEAASKADSQVNVLGIGGVDADVSSDHDSIEESAEGDGDDSGFNTDKTTDGSGPTITWTLGEGGATEEQRDPVTADPYPASDEGVKKSALDAEPYPEDHGPDLAGGGAVKGTQPADPVGNAEDRVDVLDAATTPESNNSGPTKTWSGTDGNSILRQQEPVTNETLEGDQGVKSASFTPHIVNAMKLADLEIDMGVLSKEDKYNRLAALAETEPAILAAQLQTLSRVKTAGLRKAPSIAKSAGRVPLFAKAAAASQPVVPTMVYDESLFL